LYKKYIKRSAIAVKDLPMHKIFGPYIK